MLWVSLRGYPHNDLREPKYLNVACRWSGALIGYTPLSTLSYDSWGVKFSFLWGILYVSLLSPFSSTLSFHVLKENIIHYESKIIMRYYVSWVDPIYSSTVFVFVRKGGLNRPFLDVGPFSLKWENL